MYVVAQFDPAVSFFNNGSVAVHVQSDILNRSTSGTVVIKNRTYFDLLFSATDHSRTFYVEQQTARAFYFADLQSFNLLYTPINNAGFASAAIALPYQLTTMELYSENEPLLETYPTAYPVFGFPSIGVVSRNSQLFMTSSGVQTSPASGNIPFAMFLPAVNGQLVTATILSVRISVSVASSSAATVVAKHVGVDPALTNNAGSVCTNGGVAGVPVLKTEWQNTTQAIVAGNDLVSMLVTNNTTVTELVAPGVLTLPSLNYPVGGALAGGFEFWLQPVVATTYVWNAIWQEELN